jgi:hypothetical protein
MDIVAIICVREDQDYLTNCLVHLIKNDVSYAIIDNGMGEAGRAVIKLSRFRKRLVSYTELPFTGTVELRRQLEKKEEVIANLGADWVIHLDVDEIMHSYHEEETLNQAITRVAHEGYNVIDFDEFVFLPIEEEYQNSNNGIPRLHWYYFFQPNTSRLMRARKRCSGLTALSPSDFGWGGGHRLYGNEIHLAKETFVLRHYIIRNREHAFTKYFRRVFSEAELAIGWHNNRIGYPRESYAFPSSDRLRMLQNPKSRAFDRSDPKTLHYWQW